MGVRIRYEFTSDFDGVQWQCDIHDSDYAAAINTASGNGFQITYNGNGDAPLANIKGSSCRLNLIWREDDTFYTGFINDLKGANEHEFALVIYKDSSLYWAGNITGDSLSWGNENTSRELTIDAIDGLGRLRDMNYDGILPGVAEEMTDTKQVFEVLLDLLSINDLDQFWGATDPYIEFEPHWALNTSYTDWLDRLSVPRLLFLDREEEEERVNDEPKSAYECLEIILSHLNMRIIHSDGRYWLQQVMGMSGANAATRYTYYKGNTPVSSSPWKWWQSSATTVARNAAVGTDVEVLSGGRFSYFQGLQRAEMNVPDIHFAYTNAQNTYTLRQLNPTNCPFTETSELGVIKGGTGKRIQIRIDLSGEYYLAGTFRSLRAVRNRFYIQLRVKVIAGSYRLYDNGRTDGTDLEWTTTDTSHSVYINRSTAGNVYNDAMNVVIETPDIPWSLEQVTVEITYDIIDRNTGASYNLSPAPYEANIRNVAFTFVSNGKILTLSKLAINNPTITDYENNTLYKHPDYLLDDVGLVTNQNSFQLNTTGTTFVDITAVDSGHSTDEIISETILQDAMSLQIYPIQVYEGAITGAYEPYKTFQYGSNYYVFNGGTFDAKNDEWNCQWWQSSPDLGTVGNPDRNDGKGFEYDGDDRFKPYTRQPTPWDHYGDVKDVFYGEKIGGSGGTYGDALTTLTINSATESLFKNGDELLILNPDTLELLEEVTLTSDVDASDTSISFSSVTLGNNIPPDAVILRKGSDGFCSPSIRTDEIQINGNTYTDIPTTEYYYGADTGSGTLPITASSTFYVVNTGSFNTTYSSSNISYNNSTHLFTNNTGSTKRFVVQGQLEIDSITLPAEASYDIRMAFGVNGSARTDTITRAVVSSDPDLTISTHGIIEVSSGTTFGLYLANYTNTDNIEWTRVKITIQSVN
jgi:hypothetical protein